MPCFQAAKRGHVQIVWLLLDCGANFNAVTASGLTAMDIVRLQGHTDLQAIISQHIQR